MKSNIIEAELHQKKALHQLSENGVNKMKNIYNNNMKTKQTMTILRDLHQNLVFEKTQEEQENFKLRKIPVKNIEIQTDESGLNHEKSLSMHDQHELSLEEVEFIKQI